MLRVTLMVVADPIREVVRAVFVFEGRADLSIYSSIREAEGGTEVYDLDVLSYFFDDGTVLTASAHDYQVRLTPISERRPQELRDRLREYLAGSKIGLDPAIADDPSAAALLLLERERATNTPRRWLAWMFR